MTPAPHGGGGAAARAPAKAVRLRCEYMRDPLGIDAARPRLSWELSDARPGARQHAYRVSVASSVELLRAGAPDLWDTGKRVSDQTTQVVYEGHGLRSRQVCFWRVEVWDSHDIAGEASDVALWEMGLLERADWAAGWIASPDVAPLEDYRAGAAWLSVGGGDSADEPAGCRLRRRFHVAGKPLDAAVLLTARYREGLGLPTLPVFVNGRPVEEVRCSAYYERVPITEHVTGGDCEVMIGVPPEELAQGVFVAALVSVKTATSERLRVITDGEWEQCEPGRAAHPHGTGASAWHRAGEAAADDARRLGPPAPVPRPVYFRKRFELKTAPRRARLYASACGVFKLYLNGAGLPGNALSPEWTDYSKRVAYQVWDVTSRLSAGANAVAVLLAGGWYGGALGWHRTAYNYGEPPPRVLVQLEVVADDGTTTVVSDGSWRAGYGPLLRSDLYDGELWDGALASHGWDRADFDDGAWPRARVESVAAPLVAQLTHPVEVVEEIEPVSLVRRADGRWLADFGRNLSGRARVCVSAPRTSEVVVRYGELLDPAGGLDQSNLQTARCTDTFVLGAGASTQDCEPVFAYRGFRYAEVTVSPPGAVVERVSAKALQSATPDCSELECADGLVSSLHEAIVRTQKSNTLSVLTDCPQRDERLGWSGDAQVFWRTACYNAEMAALARKWLRDFADAQTPEGIFPVVVPTLRSGLPGAPGYADAPVRLAWTTYTHYGDLRVVEENWEAMQRWMGYVHSCNPRLLWTNCRDGDLGDWLALDGGAPKELCATAHWAHNAGLMAEMAGALGDAERQSHYRALREGVARAFAREYVRDDGRVADGSQSAYAFALFYELVPAPLVPAVLGRLLGRLERDGWHMSTGIFTSQMMLPLLSKHGRDDVAYRLLLQDSFPSWGHMLRSGATTIWERWDSDRAGPRMNSRNHVALGAVGEWLFRFAGGIDFDPARPGFKHVLFRPRACPRLESFAVGHRTMRGWVRSSWRAGSPGEMLFRFELPPNTTGEAHLPADGELCAEGEGPAAGVGRAGRRVYTLEAGTAEFSVKLDG